VANSEYLPTSVPVGRVGYTVWLYIGPSHAQALGAAVALGDELEQEAGGIYKHAREGIIATATA